MQERRDYTEIIEAVKESIEKTVNGKIDRLHVDFQEYKRESQEWRVFVDDKLNGLKPFSNSLTFLSLLKNAVKETVSWLVPLATITAIVTAVYHYFHQ